MLIFMLTSLMLLSAWLLQALLPAHAILAQARYPFLLAVVVYAALNRRGWGMLLTALAAGLIQDLLSSRMPLRQGGQRKTGCRGLRRAPWLMFAR